MRSVLTLILVALTSVAAQAACALAPMPDKTIALRNSFEARMQQMGVGNWKFVDETPRGAMYSSEATQVEFFTRENGDLIEEAGLLLPAEGTTDDTVRMAAAATFLGAHISGASESDLQPRIVRAIAAARRNGLGQAMREDDAILIFSSPEPGAVALVARRIRCR